MNITIKGAFNDELSRWEYLVSDGLKAVGFCDKDSTQEDINACILGAVNALLQEPTVEDTEVQDEVTE